MLFLISQTKNIYFQRQHHNSFHPGRGQRSHKRKGTWRSATFISLCSVANVCLFSALTTFKNKRLPLTKWAMPDWLYTTVKWRWTPYGHCQREFFFLPTLGNIMWPKKQYQKETMFKVLNSFHHKENKWWGWRAGLAVESKLRLVPRTHVQ